MWSETNSIGPVHWTAIVASISIDGPKMVRGPKISLTLHLILILEAFWNIVKLGSLYEAN